MLVGLCGTTKVLRSRLVKNEIFGNFERGQKYLGATRASCSVLHRFGDKSTGISYGESRRIGRARHVLEVYSNKHHLNCIIFLNDIWNRCRENKPLQEAEVVER